MIAGLENFEGLQWRPYFGYVDCETPIEFELSVPQRPWDPKSSAVGGSDRSTASVWESFVIRHDRGVTLHLRMFESEYVTLFEPMMRTLWGQAQDFTLRLDANEPSTEHTVQLVGPWMTDGLMPRRGEYPGTYEVDLQVCTADGSPFPEYYFPEPDESW